MQFDDAKPLLRGVAIGRGRAVHRGVEVLGGDRSGAELDNDLVARLGLPDPDDMEKGDDFSAFMQTAVPAHIRNRALRKLWLTNPVLANLDELVDYGEDFTDAATVLADLKTGYQVGRGFITDEDEEDDLEGEETDDEDAVENAEETVAEAPEKSSSVRPPETEFSENSAQISDAEQGEGLTAENGEQDADSYAGYVNPLMENPIETSVSTRRRMTFRFKSS